MGYRLQISAEIRDWLGDLRDSDPPTALLVGQALTALAQEGSALGPPLVTPADPAQPDELAAALDRRYADWLESLTVMRRRVADTAMRKRDIEQQLSDPEQSHRTAELRQRLAGVIEAEEQLTVASQREQAKADAFRTWREVLKAKITAARAEYLIEEASGQDTAEASARLQDITSEIEQELGQQAPAEDLLDLRPGGAPGDGDISILFAVEPPGTALLIAVLEGRDAIRDHYREAVLLAAEVLRSVRAGQAPEALAYAFSDARSLLEEFFPGQADEVSAGAAALVAANRRTAANPPGARGRP